MARKPHQQGSIRLSERILADALCHHELIEGPPPRLEDQASLEIAQAQAGSLDRRIVARAETLSLATSMRDAYAAQKQRFFLCLGLGALVAMGVGAATANTAFANSEEGIVNFFWVLLSLLGLHLVTFLVWLLLIFIPGGARGGLLGRLFIDFWRWLSQRLDRSGPHLAVVTALTGRLVQGRASIWLASGLSHSLWCAFLTAALGMALLLLGTQHYRFVWETTILSAGSYESLTMALGALPQVLGIAVPDAAAVAAAEWRGAGGSGAAPLASSSPWPGLLIACLCLYGLLPRLAGAILCFFAFRKAAAAQPFDLALAPYARLVAEFSPATVTRIVDADDDRAESPQEVIGDRDYVPPPAPAGKVGLVAWEFDVAGADWPPLPATAMLEDFGRLERRQDLDGLLQRLRKNNGALARLVLVTGLSQAPDRGLCAVLRELQQVLSDRLFLLLSGERLLAARLAAKDRQQRLEDWLTAAQRAGLESGNVLILDLQSGDKEERHRLAQILGAEESLS